MKATDFDLSKEIKFDFETGNVTFKDSRLVIFDAAAVGLLKHEIIKSFGFEKARQLYLRSGYKHGYSDFLQMKLNYKFDSEIDLLASGPTIHTWEGIVKAIPNKIEFSREAGTFYFDGAWKNSFEAEQWLMFEKEASEPVCWTLTGYASGWSTAFFDKPLLAYEPKCCGKGDKTCSWLIMPPKEFGKEAKPYIDALKDFWK